MLGSPLRVLDPNLQELYEFYALLKSLERQLHLVFLTGVSRFTQVNTFPSLKNLQDITWDLRYAALCGSTEQEVQDYLGQHIEAAAEDFRWDLPNKWIRLREY